MTPSERAAVVLEVTAASVLGGMRLHHDPDVCAISQIRCLFCSLDKALNSLRELAGPHGGIDARALLNEAEPLARNEILDIHIWLVQFFAEDSWQMADTMGNVAGARLAWSADRLRAKITF